MIHNILILITIWNVVQVSVPVLYSVVVFQYGTKFI